MAVRAVPEVIDFEYDTGTDGAVAANATVRGADFTNIHGDHTTSTNEVLEIEKMELLPPIDEDPAGDGSEPAAMQDWDALRLFDGDAYYPNIRLQPEMLSWFGPTHHFSSVPFGNPVLSGNHNPDANPIGTCTPKFGPSSTVSPAVINDGDTIDQPFTIRLHVWRFQGTNQEFSNYLQSEYGTATFNQSITMSNPYTGNSETYSRTQPTDLSNPSGGVDPMERFDRLTGGGDQLLPKVWPWMFHTTNAQATRANTAYEFTTRNARVNEQYEQLEFDLTDGQEAVIWENLMVGQHANLSEGRFVANDRDIDPTIVLSDDDRHQAPMMVDGTGTASQHHDSDELPAAIENIVGRKQVLWDDGGGFRIVDDGTSIPANDLDIYTYGKRLELSG